MDNIRESSTVQSPEMQPSPDTLKKRSFLTINKIIVLIIILLFFVGGFAAGYFFANQKTTKDLKPHVTQISPTEKPIGSFCQKYGVLDPSEFLVSYKVRQGDTPLSIVEKQSGDITRVNEFLLLNRQYDPQLEATDGAMLTPGTTIYLLPKEVDKSSGALYGVAGKYVRTEDHDFWIRTRTTNSENGDSPIHVNTHTKISNAIKPGDCVITINDTNSIPQSNAALVIKKAESGN